MALIVEDGTSKSNAEAYLSVADADTYHNNYVNMAWFDALEGNKEAALRNATQFLDVTFGSRWNGTPTKSTQALDWPRVGAHDFGGELFNSDSLPTILKNATAELALKSLTEDLFTDEEDSGSIKSERVRVGPIELETEYSGGASQQKKFSKASHLVRELIGTFGKVLRS
jgi:prepilin-type processing-associated H-X9-DG protein